MSVSVTLENDLLGEPPKTRTASVWPTLVLSAAIGSDPFWASPNKLK